MNGYLDDTDCEPYSFQYMKKCLIDRIIITELYGKSNVVTFIFISDNILHEFYESTKQEDIVSEKYRIILRIIETATKLVRMT